MIGGRNWNVNRQGCCGDNQVVHATRCSAGAQLSADPGMNASNLRIGHYGLKFREASVALIFLGDS